MKSLILFLTMGLIVSTDYTEHGKINNVSKSYNYIGTILEFPKDIHKEARSDIITIKTTMGEIYTICSVKNEVKKINIKDDVYKGFVRWEKQLDNRQHPIYKQLDVLVINDEYYYVIDGWY